MRLPLCQFRCRDNSRTPERRAPLNRCSDKEKARRIIREANERGVSLKFKEQQFNRLVKG